MELNKKGLPRNDKCEFEAFMVEVALPKFSFSKRATVSLISESTNITSEVSIND